MEWFKWQDQISQLKGIEIARTIIPGPKPEEVDKQLHFFVDASQEVYSAVTYMRNNTNKVIVLRFVKAKSRLKPIKAACTIPRMELMAAEMGLALAKKLMATLDIQHQEIFLWTDSRAVHDWLRVESRALQIFVKNRVLKIRQYLRLDQVMWVPGVLNPADVATRGLTVTKLKEATT
jgi:ribonuclease HI